MNAFEVSGAFRSGGFSVNAELNRFDAELAEAGVTSGIYRSRIPRITCSYRPESYPDLHASHTSERFM